MDPRYDTLTDGLGVVVMKSDISGRGTSHSLRNTYFCELRPFL